MKRALLIGLLLFSAPLAAQEKEWFFKTLPVHLGNDLKESFWNRWHLAGLAAGTGATLAIHQADSEIQDAFTPEKRMGAAQDVFNFMGNSFVLGGTTLIAVTSFKLADWPEATWTAGTMLESLFLTYAITYPLKFSTQRLRPDGSNRHSFPSGHAAGSFALATVTEVFYGPWFGVPAYALAGGIALARLDANKHFASDTAAGALLGTLIGLGTAKFHKKKKPDFFVMPIVIDSGITYNISGVF